MLEQKLNPGVVNVLIDYVMLKQDNKLPYNYVMKIAASLSNAGTKMHSCTDEGRIKKHLRCGYTRKIFRKIIS